jgi:hypothetical protein
MDLIKEKTVQVTKTSACGNRLVQLQSFGCEEVGYKLHKAEYTAQNLKHIREQ